MPAEDRPGSVEGLACPPAESERVSLLYVCDCPGFRDNWPERFCLRCLEAWVAGLPANFEGKKLEAEMRRAAHILAARLKEDPTMARLSLKTALQAAETRP